jgi:hypothetical protein
MLSPHCARRWGSVGAKPEEIESSDEKLQPGNFRVQMWFGYETIITTALVAVCDKTTVTFEPDRRLTQK